MRAAVEAAFRWVGWGIDGRCAIDWREGASKKRMANDRKKAKERQEGTRFIAQIVRRCGFVAWGLRGGSFSMCARVETRGYARGLALGVDSGALSLRGARTMRAAVEATMLGGKGLTAPLARRKNDASGG